MNPTQDASFVSSGKSHFSQLQPFCYPIISLWKDNHLLLQVIGSYQWKDENVDVESLSDDDSSSPAPTPKPASWYLHVLESCLNFLSESSQKFSANPLSPLEELTFPQAPEFK